MNSKKPQVLLLSIKPQFVRKILDGQKTVELRKVKPQLTTGDFILIYESSPSKCLIGWFEVKEIICEKPQILWKKVKNDAGITKEEFNTYYQKSMMGVAIRIKDKHTIKLPLDKIREKWTTFRPPQSFHYLKEKEVSIAEEITNYSLPICKSLSSLTINY
ncbi:ASCH domain-containing protein [Cyanobacterium aponinum FACHB-4101]|uniref:ASCH domain-containing protein n=1 Tax=Cyanobacterium aponinum TaxID=379064 RepID=UPI00167FE986|nr:ASCH domain-containing protein [Cyanobacterium aponinum]MBD2395151.1 ASCH domain-containing protein [Cyanobacterium aponinum FACHB-4101]